MEKLIECSKIADETSRNFGTKIERKAGMLRCSSSCSQFKILQWNFLAHSQPCGTRMKFSVRPSCCTPWPIGETWTDCNRFWYSMKNCQSTFVFIGSDMFNDNCTWRQTAFLRKSVDVFIAEGNPWDSRCRENGTHILCLTRHPEFDFRQGQRIFLLCTASRPALGPTQLPIYR
jgi:hypothetical protein